MKRSLLKYTLVCQLIVFASCQDKPCLPPQADITASDLLFEGETLELTAASVPGASYSWTGPNGFSSNEQNPTIAGVTTDASGTYTVTVHVDDCENTATKEIEVMANAGCSPDSNTISFLSKMTFYPIACPKDKGGYFQMQGNGPQGDFTIEFYTNPFEKGSFVYEFSNQDNNPYNVFMQIDSGGILSNWQGRSGKLYVRIVNGKLTMRFCDAVFGNIQNGAIRKVSGSISCT